MILRGNAHRYGLVAAAIHWISAAAILALLVLGFAAANSADQLQKVAILQLHVPLGSFVLALTIIRIGWWFFDTRPEPPAGQPRWQALTASAVHKLLYLLLILMGASGICLLVLSGAAQIIFFGALLPLPEFSKFAPMAAHAIGAFAMIVLLGLHIFAALYHQLYRKDRLLARMLIAKMNNGQ